MANGYQPGERLIQAALNGQIDGQRLGQILFEFLPSMPFEEGFPLPRFASRRPAPAVIVPPAPVIPAPVQQPTVQVLPVITPAPAAAQPRGRVTIDDLARLWPPTSVRRITQI